MRRKNYSTRRRYKLPKSDTTLTLREKRDRGISYDRCIGVKADGNRCTRRELPGSFYCRQHQDQDTDE